MKRVVLVLAPLVLCVLFYAPVALAQEQQESGGTAGQRLQERGEAIQQRIELLITRFENNKERHVEAYNRAKEKVRSLLEVLEGKGYDVSRLAQDLQAWDAMIVKFAQDYAAFIAKLKEVSGLAVGGTEGEFRSGLREARQLLRQVHEDALDIRLYYQQTIRSDIQDLRDQVPAS